MRIDGIGPSGPIGNDPLKQELMDFETKYMGQYPSNVSAYSFYQDGEKLLNDLKKNSNWEGNKSTVPSELENLVNNAKQVVEGSSPPQYGATMEQVLGYNDKSMWQPYSDEISQWIVHM